MAIVSFGADERTELTDALLTELRRRGFEVMLYGPAGGGIEQWAEIGERVANDVVSGRVASGIACCWTGTGVSMAANKVRGARAALCIDAEIARGARRWNDANVLCLSLEKTNVEDIPVILDAWFGTSDVDEGERENIDRLSAIERGESVSTRC